jgi:hypothetical protein
VTLTDGSIATVPIFYVRAILVAFLNDPFQMREEFFAPNYDIFTGKAKERKQTLAEIHTGSLWEPARQRYCGDNPNAFPLALVCFFDKTNNDVFGSLSCATFIYNHHSSTKTVAKMIQITFYWVIFQSWICKRKSKKTDSSDEITG